MDDLVNRPILPAPAARASGRDADSREHGVPTGRKARRSVGEHEDEHGTTPQLVPTEPGPAGLTPLDGGGASATASGGGMEGLGARLKELRQQAGFSLRELARQADVSPSLVSQIENGKSRPSVSTLYTFARLLNVAVDELFDAEEPDVGDSGGHGRGGLHDPANVRHPSEYPT